ncbi:hypothetical protein vBVpaS1601_63 [Vibrio phage vB_VpaS_1601]|uniref:hypothetical protein n=1 Tax=Vibrio phage SHOU24 TaxID=1414739 RepID=UPI0003ED1E24|nr:hypothetical protein SHOU24_18 [Vibrio phage SHOU24]AHI61215.1 hypothetical protein SHOU24_18 [Vibrio phage SHOU24]WHM52756.1 hypothetical protein vBVpaP1601_63 [Vibrio phage vB_VpaP_1601]
MTQRTGITEITAPVAAGSPDTPLAVHFNNEQQGGLKLFNTEAEMQGFKVKFKSRLFGSVAIVPADTGDQFSVYRWNGTQTDGSDGDWVEMSAEGFDGMTFVNADGSSTTGIQMLALSGITLEGNEKDGFTLKVSGGAGGGVTFEERVNYAQYDNIKRVLVGPYLELNALRDKQGGPATGVEIGVKPDTFELRKTPGFLSYVQYPELVYGKMKDGNFSRKGAIWPELLKVSPEGFLQIDRANKAIGLQDTNPLDDPNVSGGSKFLVWPFVYLEGVAPDDGYVELRFVKKDDHSIAEDIDGHAMAVRHNYKAGDVLTPKHEPLMFTQVIAAKGVTEYQLVIVDNFDEYVKVLDYTDGPSGLCIQELRTTGSSSEALIRAEIDTGFSVRVDSYYVGTYLASINYLTSMQEPAVKVDAGEKASTVAGIQMHAITDLMYSVEQGMIKVNDYNGNVCDFYLGLEIPSDLSRVLAGEGLEVELSLQDKDSGWKIGFFSYKGDMGSVPNIFDRRDQGSIVLNKGWSEWHSGFIPEDAVSGLHTAQESATVPKDADYVVIAVYPVSAQSPISFNLKAFHVDAANPHDDYTINPIRITGLQHLDFMTETVKLVQDTQGYASLRYTINNDDAGNPMPLGIPESKLKFMHLDKTKNIVSGSGAKGGEGALVADNEIDVTVSQKWQLYNEQMSASTTEFWLMLYKAGDGSVSEVPNSRTTFTVESKRPGVDYFTTNEVTINMEPGDYIYARSKSDSVDGAYTQTTQESKPLCITYVTEKALAP